MLNTPILFIVFNRLETTKQVFEAIRRAKPRELYIAADGPRQNRPEDKEKCAIVREYVESHIDWDCKINKLFRNENMGCGKAVSGAITWFFSQVEQGIILEDDCLPSDSFFSYCEELLIQYQDNTRIMHIAGHNPLGISGNTKESYYFANIQHCWGWASWRRAWGQYRFDIETTDCNRKTNPYFSPKATRNHWEEIFIKMSNHEVDTWDYQWTYRILKCGGLCINPTRNLVSNIGFADGVHYSDPDLPIADRYEIMKIVHPKAIRINKKLVKQIDTTEYKINHSKINEIWQILRRNAILRKIKHSFS